MPNPISLEHGIVAILNKKGEIRGTGFLVAEHLIATCAHVVVDAGSGPGENVSAYFRHSDKTFTAKVIEEYWRPRKENSEDVAFLLLEDELPEFSQVLRLGNYSNQPQSFTSHGYPALGDYVGITGTGMIVSAVYKADGRRMLQLNSQQIEGGFSGAPVWDAARHQVVGMISEIWTPRSGWRNRDTSFAIPSEVLHVIYPEIPLEAAAPETALAPGKQMSPAYLKDMPDTLRERFVGRDVLLNQIYEELEGKRLEGQTRACVLQGTGGTGKTQLASEYLWRNRSKYYPGGTVWINADCDEATLVRQFRGVLEVFDPHADSPTMDTNQQLKILSDKLVEAIARREVQADVLWVVDNVPEPSRNAPTRSLVYWCPPREYVQLLCTSRRTSIRDADALIRIEALPISAAVALLTQPAVDPAWLNEAEWQAIARWVGGLPLALHILQLSLSEGFLRPAELLEKVRSTEPAAALEAEFEALQDEIPANYLRGVAEAFNVSYQLLADYPDTQLAAHLISRLSPILLSENMLEGLIPARALGKLANRGWVEVTAQEAGTGNYRQWQMHRVIASFLRGVSANPDAELFALVNWLSASYKSQTPWPQLEKYLPHTVYVFNGLEDWHRKNPEMEFQALAAGSQLGIWLTTWELEDETRGNLHFIAAGMVEALGMAETLVAQLRPLYRQGNAKTGRGIINILAGMPESEAAARLCAEMIGDPREPVRVQALLQAPRFRRAAPLAIPFMNALLADIDEKKLFQPSSSQFEEVIRIEHYWQGDPFWELPDSFACRQALAVLGETGFNEEMYRALVASLQNAATSNEKLKAIDRLGLYLRTIETPHPLKVWSYQEHNLALDEYSPRMEINLPTDFNLRPELFNPLVQFILESEEAAAVHKAVENVALTLSGKKEILSAAVYDLLDREDFGRTVDLATAVVELYPEFTNGYWWRGQGHEGLGNLETAIADYGRVISDFHTFIPVRFRRAVLYKIVGSSQKAERDFEALVTLKPDNAYDYFSLAQAYEELGNKEQAITAYSQVIEHDPDFVQAYRQRAFLRYQIDDPEGALPDLEAVIAFMPEEAQAYHLKAACLLNLDRPVEAIEAADQAIRRQGDIAEYWLFRAWAYTNLERYDEALQDAEKTLELDPNESRAEELKDYIETKLEQGEESA